MELRQLKYFHAVVSAGGFTRASEQLHVAQSAVSAQVRALESELGVELLARTTRRVGLTHAGELFLIRVQRVLAEIEGARGDVAELTAVLRGRVSIGATQVLGPFDLPAALARFHARFPGVSISLRSGLMAALLVALDAGDLDMVLGPIHAGLPSRFSTRPLFDEELVLISPLTGPLARKHAVSLADVASESFVCLGHDSGLRAILTQAAQAAGFEPIVQFETHGPASIRELVSAGLGVALIARSTATGAGPPVAVHLLRPAPAHPVIGMISHQDHRITPAARAWRQHLVGYATVGEPEAGLP